MGGISGLNIARGIVGGIAGAAGDPNTQQQMDAANQQENARQQALQRARIAPFALNVKNLNDQVTNAPVDSPLRDQNSPEYAGVKNQIQQNIHAMRDVLHPDTQNSASDWLQTHITDGMHITNAHQREFDKAKKAADTQQQESNIAGWQTYGDIQKAKGTEATVAGQAAQQAKAAQMDFDRKAALIKQNLPPEQQESALHELTRQHAGLPAGVKPTLKEFVSPNGQDHQWFDASHPENIPQGWQATGGVTKPLRGTLVKSASSPTGFAQTWVDPTNPGKIVGWQPVTASRYLQGTTSTSTTTDPFGVSSTTSRSTAPAGGGSMDLSGIAAMPADENSVAPHEAVQAAQAGLPVQAPASGPMHRQLQQVRSQVAAGPMEGVSNPPNGGSIQPAAHPPAAAPVRQLDETGHIPATAANPRLVEIANQIIDGADIDKTKIPQRDAAEADRLARSYGWAGQGTFTPQQKLLVNEASAKLQQFFDSPSLHVLDSTKSREKIGTVLQGADPKTGFIGHQAAMLASGLLTPDENQFITDYNAAIGVLGGLAPITRGNKQTEAGVNRLIVEMPNVVTTSSASVAKQKLNQLLQEVDLAKSTDKTMGKPSGQRQIGETKKFPNGKTGVWDGHGWVAQ